MGRKRKKIVTPMQGVAHTMPDVIGEETTLTAEVVMEPVYSFPSRSRCPRCRSINTKAVGKHGHTQYRVCQQPICRRQYAVKGELV